MKIKLIFIMVFVTGTLFICTTFFVTLKVIKNHLNEICINASEKYGCPPREALIVQLNDDNLPVRLKNRTIWAIGKMKVTDALPELEKCYQEYAIPGNKYSNCLHEVEKAVGYMKYNRVDIMSFRNFSPK
jgi:hypothetical protein